MKHKIYLKYFNFDNLLLGWERVIRWSDRSTKDLFGIKTFGFNLEFNLKNLSSQIINGEYKPTRPQKYYVPKPSMMQRTKTILTIEDAIVYQAIANIIAVNAYEKLKENENFIFGSVLSPEVKLGTKILELKGEQNFFFFQHYLNFYKKFADSINKAILEDKVKYKFETDITGFFDCIPHYNLLKELSDEFKVELIILDFLERCLNCWSGTRDNYTLGVGIPQGPQPSFFLANLLLHRLDNEIITDALKYYRYMDDIRIYGYDQKVLQNALIKIDSYLKGHALSLNAKKTSIEPVKIDGTDESIINFEVYDLNEEDNKASDIDFEMLADQDNSLQYAINNKNITDKIENLKFWEKELRDVSEEITNLFLMEQINEIFHDGNIELNKKDSERNVLKLCYRYRIALKEINTYKITLPEVNLLKFLYKLLNNFFWRADQICWVLNYYKGIEELKVWLFSQIKEFSSYEWVRSNLITTLSITQIFSNKELIDIHGMLMKEKSEYVRIAYYKLLVFHCNDEQLFSTVQKEIKNENELNIKKELLYYIKKKVDSKFSFIDMKEAFGL